MVDYGQCVICKSADAQTECGYCEGAVCREHYHSGLCTDCAGTGRSAKHDTMTGSENPEFSDTGAGLFLLFWGLFAALVTYAGVSTGVTALLSGNFYGIIGLGTGLLFGAWSLFMIGNIVGG